MTKKDYIIIGLVVALFAALAIYIKATQKQTAFVKVTELYNEFDMKKELEANYMQIEKGRKAQLDSLEIELKLMNKRFDAEGTGNKEMVNLFEMKRENYLLKKQQFEEDNALMQQTYNADIMKQLNQYVSDFGVENKYEYIFGAEGSGAIMHAEKSKDITNEVKTYINAKYKGKK